MDRLAPAALKVGDTLPETKLGPISRSMLALYAGASGDHNPVHIDSDAARQAGMPDVIAPGMLVLGAMSQRLCRWVGVEHLRSLQVRFTAIAHLHDTITFSGVISEIFEHETETRARIQLVGASQLGREIITGDAIVDVTS